MSGYIKKYFPLFMSSSDEQLFDFQLKEKVPAVCFVDGSSWETSEPPIKEAISDCTSPIIYLWNRDAIAQLPFNTLDNGLVRGPTSGIVIQYIRSKYQDSILKSGDMAIGYRKDDLAVAEFVRGVWKIARELNAGTLESFDRVTGNTLEKGIRNYVVGPGAVDFVCEGGVLKHCSAEVYYRVE